MTIDWHERVLVEVDALRDQAVADLVELVRIPSVTGTDAEHDAQAWLAARFARDGLEVDHWQVDLEATLSAPACPGTEAPREELWGLVGRVPGRGGGASLLLNGHVDVVPTGDLGTWQHDDPFSGHLTGGEVRGRGACDMKGGLVAAWWAVRALQVAGVPLLGDLHLASVASEEDGGLGTFAMIERGWGGDVCVVPEPTGLDVVPACAGALTFRIRIPGLATHAARRTEGVSAVEKLWPVWWALVDLERRRNAVVDPLVQRWPIAYPISIGTVRAGSWASSVPDVLVAEGRFGVALDERLDEARAALEAAVEGACQADPWLRDHPVGVEWWGGQFGPGRLPEGSDLVARVQAAHVAVTKGARPEVWGAPYGTDLRLLVGAGIPTVHYGPGDARLAHAPDESVSLDEVATAAAALATLALDVCGVGI